MSKQTHTFQAEVAQLLHLVTHSLYSNPEIFLRELISNASDACDKLRFEALADETLYGDQPELRVRLTFDKDAHTVTVTDTGIGMSAEEATSNLGTIAKSGTRAFVDQLTGDQKTDAQLIGQFGVGFYSGFIVADRIVVESRRAGLPPEQGVRWSSEGSGNFEVEAITRAERGTRVTLHLREDAHEFADGWRLRELVSKYSDHISLPIQMEGEKWEEGKEEGQPGQMVKTGEWETINQASALWTRARSEISDEQYIAFYKQIAHDFEAPLAWTHNRVEGTAQYTQLLYLPARAPMDIWDREQTTGVKLYVQRVFIMDDAEQIVPRYLRFVKGVVDSADLPLNISRELLQHSRDVKSIRDGNTRRILALLEQLAHEGDAAAQPGQTPGDAGEAAADAAEDSPSSKAEESKYAIFWREFGAVLKEGLAEDLGNRERIARLLRYASTESDLPTVSLADYKARMKDGQKAIYYVTADTPAAARNSPQLEIFRKKGIEVLLMTDRIDEWAMSYLNEFDGTPLQSVAKGAVDLGELEDETEKKAAEEAAEHIKPLLDRLKQTLADSVEDVRVTTRLVDSPACLVVKDSGMSLQFARIMRQAGQDVPNVKPVLEINAGHPLVQKLEDSPHFDDLAHILFDQALLAEGGLPDDPASYVRRVNALLV
ncbi:MAG: molecular chaperone HtpG [Ottowia sp.]|nr:molecular chaperone HtpG [Ottowia sp.]